jgi:hypothetical protein
MFVKLISPLTNAIYQRDSENKAFIQVKFRITKLFFKKPQTITIQIVSLENDCATIGEPIVVPYTKYSSVIQREIYVPAGGWYCFKVIITDIQQKIVLNEFVGKFGVGEVFVTAGQSNSANSGQTRLKVESDTIMAWSLKKWQLANDPQPIANGDGGTPWVAMANVLNSKLKLPIGLISIGVGGTAVSQWIPTAEHYPRFKKAMDSVKIYGCRAVLWHQGESDVLNHTSSEEYAQKLESIIQQTRIDSGQIVTWIIAQASFIPDPSVQGTEYMENVVKGQQLVVKHGFALQGPNTDALLGSEWRHDNLHFNFAGLNEHGKLWAEFIIKYLNDKWKIKI